MKSLEFLMLIIACILALLMVFGTGMVFEAKRLYKTKSKISIDTTITIQNKIKDTTYSYLLIP